jgi:hypothetical protein
MVDLSNFERTSYGFPGIYRGVVEDNADPLDAGRIRVRIREIHTEDGIDLPVNKLPWAEPAIGLYWSGGRNIANRDHISDENGKGNPDPATVPRYNPNPPALAADGSEPKNIIYPNKLPQGDNTKSKSTTYDVYDTYGEACGTGGIYTIPKRGNWVFIFFENGNHMNPIYFAMAPNRRDWDYQKAWRNGEIDQKIGQLKEFVNDFTDEQTGLTKPRDEIQGKDWATHAKVDARVIEPKLYNINATKDIPDSNRDVTCITSLNGTSIIIDNRANNEQIYVIHKNYMEYTDKVGNRTVYVGKQRGINADIDANEKPVPNDKDIATNYQVGVEGNHYLHILGNYDMFVHGRIHIQCDEHVQIDAQKSVGIVSREGDVDIILEKGNVNLDVQNGYVDAHIEKNLNAHVVGNANVKIDGELKATVGKNAHIKSENIFVNSGNADIILSGNAKIQANKIDITASDLRLSGNMHIGGNIKVNGTCDIKKLTRLGAELSVQTGINCGGYLYNRGIANIGSPVIAHGLQVVGGNGAGQTKGSDSAESPTKPESAIDAKQETENTTDKDFTKSDPT